MHLMQTIDCALSLKRDKRSKMKIFVISILAMGIFGPSAMADSFWNHNGSLMRLHASGNERVFEYEVPSPKMRATGVQKGTILFYGVRQGNRYVGTARVFSRDCSVPLEYRVEGRVVTEKYVVLSGQREVYAPGCVPTGRMIEDMLEFRYKFNE